MTGDKKMPFWARCPNCGHLWAAAYYQMLLAQLADVLRHVHCPMCGNAEPVVAKQDGGRLLEPAR